jgi:hypothetical protein
VLGHRPAPAGRRSPALSAASGRDVVVATSQSAVIRKTTKGCGSSLTIVSETHRELRSAALRENERASAPAGAAPAGAAPAGAAPTRTTPTRTTPTRTTPARASLRRCAALGVDENVVHGLTPLRKVSRNDHNRTRRP